MGIKSSIKSKLGEGGGGEPAIPEINGVALVGNKTSAQLHLAPEGYADDSVWSTSLDFVESTNENKLTLKCFSKDQSVIEQYDRYLPTNYYIDAEVSSLEEKITLTRKSGLNTTELNLTGITSKYVPKTTSIGSNTLENDITISMLNDDLKDYLTTLTNKTINADNNVISNLITDNFKSGVIKTSINHLNPLDTTIPTEKAVYDYAGTFGKLIEFSRNADTLTIKLKDRDGNVLNTQTQDKIVITDETQTLTNKTIECNNNTLKLNTNKNNLINLGFLAIDNENKLWVKNSTGELICLNDDYKINNLTIPQSLVGKLKTDETLLTESDNNDVLLRIKYPVRVINYAMYSALPDATKMLDVIYIVPDYPCPDVVETREMVNNRWVITRTATTTPLLTFLFKKEVHNYHVYYTKPEVNALLDYKEDIINGGASTITHDNLTADKILVSDGNGKVIASEYSVDTLEGVGLYFTPSVSISTRADPYISLVEIKAYVVNKTTKAYRLDLTFNVDNVCPTYTFGGIATITFPVNYPLNYNNSPYQQGFSSNAIRFANNTDYFVENMIARYVDNTTIQLLLPQTKLFEKVGRVNCSLMFF